ncbi:toxin-antitoxin system YwqK family antitoxin [Confluentibacter flavum]|uniref:Nicotinic acid mononucleotide adenyltransferase n=1 Tax=Confluentibacter flavum TaxID=1909700 RepID=A0A2N3HIH7_9FLAO|nr:nicotinic acid mononucleotide adenyltransferase [Confluentibacter flavum]PKQ44692.1 nicotinic acid mononucleotide adenyltransferase [Confluentibacter flavum]
MKKYILILAIVFIGTSVFAQENTQKVTHVQKKDLIEATYYYADGSVQQVGTFNEEGKLHGTWTSFDTNGNKLAVGNYENGKKEGKWIFYTNGLANEVSFEDSKIVNIATSTDNL